MTMVILALAIFSLFVSLPTYGQNQSEKQQLQQTEAKPYFQRLAELLSEKEYQMSKDILIGKK
jgi:hypothetical protein